MCSFQSVSFWALCLQELKLTLQSTLHYVTQYYMIWDDFGPDVTSKILQQVNTVHPSVASPTLIVLGVAYCRHCRQWLPVNIHSILWTETLWTGGIGVHHRPQLPVWLLASFVGTVQPREFRTASNCHMYLTFVNLCKTWAERQELDGIPRNNILSCGIQPGSLGPRPEQARAPSVGCRWRWPPDVLFNTCRSFSKLPKNFPSNKWSKHPTRQNPIFLDFLFDFLPMYTNPGSLVCTM